MPSDSGVDDGYPRIFQSVCEFHHFLPGGTILYKVQKRETENDQEAVSDSSTHRRDDLSCKAHAVLVITAPFVFPMIGTGHEKLIDQVAFRPHDLNPVISRRLSELSSTSEILNRRLNPAGTELPGFEWGDRGLQGGGCDIPWGIPVATRMEKLHANETTMAVDLIGHCSMFPRRRLRFWPRMV